MKACGEAAKFCLLAVAVGVTASCGTGDSVFDLERTASGGTKGEYESLDPALGLTNGSYYFSDIVRHPWFYANPDGSPLAGYSRPINFDKSFASLVAIEDLATKQMCTGTRIAERSADGSLHVWILTAAHCFVQNTLFGMRMSGADTQKTLRIYRFHPYVQDGSAINTNWKQHFRLYRSEPVANAQIVNPKRVLQLGTGDVIKILFSENVSQSEVDTSTQSLCRANQLGSAFPLASSPIGKLAVGAYKDPSNGLWQTPVLIGHPVVQAANQTSPWNLNPQVLKLVSDSSIEFGSNQKFALNTSTKAIAAGELPSPIMPTVGSVDGSIYSFTHFTKNSGVTAGDSGVPIFETTQSASGVIALNCVSGVVVREFWSNPFGSAGATAGSLARRIGGLGAGIEPTTVIHKISDSDNSNWLPVFPHPRVGILRAGVVGTTKVINSAAVNLVKTDIKLASGIVIRPSGTTVLPESNLKLPRNRILPSQDNLYHVSFQTRPNTLAWKTFYAIKDVSKSGVTDRELNECISLLNYFRGLPVQVKVRCSLDSVPLLEFDIRANSKRK